MKKIVKTLIQFVVVCAVGFALLMSVRIGVAYLTGYDIITREPVVICEDEPVDDGPVRTSEMEVSAND